MKFSTDPQRRFFFKDHPTKLSFQGPIGNNSYKCYATRCHAMKSPRLTQQKIQPRKNCASRSLITEVIAKSIRHQMFWEVVYLTCWTTTGVFTLLVSSMLVSKLLKDNEMFAIPLNDEHDLTRQRRWDKQETQEYMWHFNALKLDKLTSRSSTASYAVRWTRGRKKESSNVQLCS